MQSRDAETLAVDSYGNLFVGFDGSNAGFSRTVVYKTGIPENWTNFVLSPHFNFHGAIALAPREDALYIARVRQCPPGVTRGLFFVEHVTVAEGVSSIVAEIPDGRFAFMGIAVVPNNDAVVECQPVAPCCLSGRQCTMLDTIGCAIAEGMRVQATSTACEGDQDGDTVDEV